MGTAGRMKGGNNIDTVTAPRAKLSDLNFGLDAGAASYVEEQSPSSISSSDLSVLYHCRLVGVFLSWGTIELAFNN